MNNTTQKIVAIEELRAIAVLLVFFHHVKGNLVPAAMSEVSLLGNYIFGWVGVDLFFAISGFVVAKSILPLTEQTHHPQQYWSNVGVFWRKRLWRLFPSAWFWLVAALLLSVFYNQSGIFGSWQTNLGALIAGVLNIANFRFADAFGSYHYGASFVYWSLSLEVQFYLLLPILMYITKRWFVFCLALLILIQAYMPETLLLMSIRSEALLLGVLLALFSRSSLYQACKPTGLNNKLIALITTTSLVFMLVVIPSEHLNITNNRITVIALLSALLVWIASYGERYIMPFAFLSRPLQWIGARSYAIYLIHIPVFFAIREFYFRSGWGEPSSLSVIFFALAAVLLISDLSFRFIEKPLRIFGANASADATHMNQDNPRKDD